MRGQLALPNFGIGIIGEKHGSNPIGYNACFFQFLVILPDNSRFRILRPPRFFSSKGSKILDTPEGFLRIPNKWVIVGKGG